MPFFTMRAPAAPLVTSYQEMQGTLSLIGAPVTRM
jgi:hypothetical protein